MSLVQLWGWGLLDPGGRGVSVARDGGYYTRLLEEEFRTEPRGPCENRGAFRVSKSIVVIPMHGVNYCSSIRAAAITNAARYVNLWVPLAPAWSSQCLSPVNFAFSHQSTRRIEENRANQGRSCRGWKPSLATIMKTDTHQSP